MSQEAKAVLDQLIKERYSTAKAIFWGGSIAMGEGHQGSDLDVVVIYDDLERARREAFIYKEWPVDAFIHDLASIQYFFNQVDKGSFIMALPTMVAKGILLTKPNEISDAVLDQANSLLATTPKLSSGILNLRRFLITDLLDDLKAAHDPHEQLATQFSLYQSLAEFYLLRHEQWLGSGKQIARRLKQFNPDIAEQFNVAFSQLANIEMISELTDIILSDAGGLLWDGFQLPADYNCKLYDQVSLTERLLEKEQSLLTKMVRHDEKVLNQILRDDFIEISKFGQQQNKQQTIAAMLSADGLDSFVISDFAVSVLSTNTYRTQFSIDQNGVRSIRTSIWCLDAESGWQMCYHQGTIVQS